MDLPEDTEQKRGRFIIALMWAAFAAIGMSIMFVAGRDVGRKEYRPELPMQPAVSPAGKPLTLTPMEMLTIEDMRNKQTEQIRIRRHSDGSWSARSVQKTPAARTFGEDGIVIEDTK